MKKMIWICISLGLFCVSGLSQSSSQSSANSLTVPVKVAMPNYPKSGVYLFAEECINVKMEVASDGTIVRNQFKARYPFFGASVRRVLKFWRFNDSELKTRDYSIEFCFVLVPEDSDMGAMAVFEEPGKINIYGYKLVVAP